MSKITVAREGDKWVAKFAFDFATKDVVKAAGFRFDGARKLWYTTDPATAAKLASPDVVALINRERVEKQDRKSVV